MLPIARKRVLKRIIRRSFYRNGQIREEIPLRHGQKHGIVRTWHKNGVIATEEPHRNGQLHGVCRQWADSGRLLGKYRMVQGTGIQRAWHDNGRLQMEVSTVRGEFCGRNRIWLRDGTLLSERFYLHGRIVSADEYRAAAKNGTLPKVRSKPASLPPKNDATRKHIYRVFVASLLKRQNRTEAAEWLTRNGADTTARSLGRFKRERDAGQLVKRLYRAGAAKVIVLDIYGNKRGDQFADGLLVRLPKDSAKRRAVRRVCSQLRSRDIGAIQPDRDIGETYLYLYLA